MHDDDMDCSVSQVAHAPQPRHQENNQGDDNDPEKVDAVFQSHGSNGDYNDDDDEECCECLAQPNTCLGCCVGCCCSVTLCRIFISLLLLIAGVAATYYTYHYLSNAEEEQFEQSFHEVAETIMQAASNHQQNVLDVAVSLASTMTLTARSMVNATTSNTTVWPNFTLPYFEQYAKLEINAAGIEMMGVANVVLPNQSESYLQYAGQNYEAWMVRGHNLRYWKLDNLNPVNYHNFIWENGPNHSVVPAATGRDLYFPVWTTYPPPADYMSINWDFGSDSDYGVPLQLIATGDVDSSLFTKALPLTFQTDAEHDRHYKLHSPTTSALNGNHQYTDDETPDSIVDEDRTASNPHSFLFTPVQLKLIPDAAIVAIVFSTVAWDAPLLNLFQEKNNTNTEDHQTPIVDVVFRNTCGQVFSYRVVGKDAIFQGYVDQHDGAFDDMRRLLPLPPLESSVSIKSNALCFYSMEIYPTNQFQAESTTSIPRVASLAVAGIFLVSLLAFLVYDEKMHRRMRRLATESFGGQRPQSTDNAPLLDNIPTERTSSSETEIFMTVLVGAVHGLLPSAANTAFLDKLHLAFKQAAENYDDIQVDNLGARFIATIREASEDGESALLMCRFAQEWSKHVELLIAEAGDAMQGAVLRMGIHSGREDPSGAFLGETTQNAVWLELACEPGRILVSDTTFETVKSRCEETATIRPDLLDVHRNDAIISFRTALDCSELTDDDMNEGAVLENETEQQPTILFQEETSAEKETTAVFQQETCSEKETEQNTECNEDAEHSTLYYTENFSENLKAVVESEQYTPHSEESCPARRLLDDMNSNEEEDEPFQYNNAEEQVDIIQNTLIDSVYEELAALLLQLVSSDHNPGRTAPASQDFELKDVDVADMSYPIDLINDIIPFSKRQNSDCWDEGSDSSVEVSDIVLKQLRDLLSCIGRQHKSNPYHNFEHSCNAAIWALKLLHSWQNPPDTGGTTSDGATVKQLGRSLSKRLIKTLRETKLHPPAQIAIVLACLMLNIDHHGMPNAQIIDTDDELASKFKRKSVSQQNALAKGWTLFMDDRFKDLRQSMFASTDDLRFFRAIVVNGVLATDVESRHRRKYQAIARSTESRINTRDPFDREMTTLVESLIEAAHVWYTLDTWEVYIKWNQLQFKEMLSVHERGLADANPSDFWVRGETFFFDDYVIPLMEKLQTYGLQDEENCQPYVKIVRSHRRQWSKRGNEILAQLQQAMTTNGSATS